MTDSFEVGDTVELKSGGPQMTVERIYDDGDVSCVWFAGEKQQAHIFRRTSLKKSDS